MNRNITPGESQKISKFYPEDFIFNKYVYHRQGKTIELNLNEKSEPHHVVYWG